MPRNCSGEQLLYGDGLCTTNSAYKVGQFFESLSDCLGTVKKINRSRSAENISGGIYPTGVRSRLTYGGLVDYRFSSNLQLHWHYCTHLVYKEWI